MVPMSYKTVLVHVDHDKRCPARLDFAAQFALAWGAHLTGLHTVAPVRIPGYAQAEMGDELVAQQRRRLTERGEELATRFADTMRRHGLVGFDWRAEAGDAYELVELHARYCDLAIVGQHDPNDDGGSVAAEFPEVASLSVARPLLIFPYVGRFEPVAKHVLVCWNASREATRAVTDALPALTRAQKVTVLTVNAKPTALGHGARPGADLALYLARHDVKVEVAAQYATDLEIGDLILSRAAEIGADLIVMGAYGHSRMRELVFGGVTQSLLRHMTVPVMVSH